MMTLDCTLADASLDAAAEYAQFAALAGPEGALASFTGLARPASKGGEAVIALILDHHPRLTLASMQDIGQATLERFAATRLRIVHRCGAVLPGEAIVFVAAAALHRRAALEAVDYAMDRLKTDAVFWKREDATSGSQWIEPTDADGLARARWDSSEGDAA